MSENSQLGRKRGCMFGTGSGLRDGRRASVVASERMWREGGGGSHLRLNGRTDSPVFLFRFLLDYGELLRLLSALRLHCSPAAPVDGLGW